MEQVTPISRNAAYSLLQDCKQLKTVKGLRRLQFLMICNGLDNIAALGDQLIKLFTNHKCLPEANKAFNKITSPTTYTGTAIIWTDLKLGHAEKGFKFYSRIKRLGVKCDKYFFVAVLKACTVTQNISEGKIIHYELIKSGFLSDVVVANTLLDMYVKCGSLSEAYLIFKYLPEHDSVSCNIMLAAYFTYEEQYVAIEYFERMQLQGINLDLVSWNTIIAGCTQDGNSLMALNYFQKMNKETIEMDKVTMLIMLRACSHIKTVQEGRILHDQIIRRGLQVDVEVGSALVGMYAKCASLEEAHNSFCKLESRDVVSWSAMVAGYTQYGDVIISLQYFESMQLEGIKPDEVAFASALQACAAIGTKEQGRLVHEQTIECGVQLGSVTGSTLIDMYAKCMCLEEARKVLDNLLYRDVISWNSLIMGCSQHGESSLTVQYFEEMLQECVEPTEATYLAILKACVNMGSVAYIRCIHQNITGKGFSAQSNVSIGNTLVDVYAKYGSLEEAVKVFSNLPCRDVASWAAMIGGYSHHDNNFRALECFDDSQHDGIKADKIIHLGILKACIGLGALKQGRLIHEQIMGSGCEQDIIVGNTLLDMYCKCKSLEEAYLQFTKLPTHNVISWNTMIFGYAHHGEGLLALKCFEQMQQEGIFPDDFTFSSVVRACAGIGALEQGKLIHELILKQGLHLDVGNTLIDMYAKCGKLEEAWSVFCHLPSRDILSWGAMIAGYAQYGQAILALECFEWMQKEGVKPNEVLFTSVLTACSRATLVDQGCWYFNSLRVYHDIKPTVSHCICMVDLLARAGRLAEAEQLLQANMPDNSIPWISLLNACKIHGNIEVAKCCFHKVMNLDSDSTVAYIIMSNIYADAHRQVMMPKQIAHAV